MATLINIFTLITLVVGLFFVILRFGLHRENATFLNLTVTQEVLGTIGELHIVFIGVKLENKGQTRIDARIRTDVGDEYKNFLYCDSEDQCEHAGTLKIRALPMPEQPSSFDWYSLEPIKGIVIFEGGKQTVGDLEQINYLAEFQDPDVEYRDVHFWLEPAEQYQLQVMVALRPGIYGVKAYFLGKNSFHHEEEYWSCTHLFSLNNANVYPGAQTKASTQL